MIVEASAPGKLVLLGEYAVLEGAPALVAAIDRRARVRLEPTQGAGCVVSAPGLLREDLRIIRAGNDGWKDRLPLLARAVEIDPELLSRSHRIVLDTTAFFHETGTGAVKMGLGSSAALTAALLGAARQQRDPADSSYPPLRELLEFHRSLQGGTGSGIDLAAALAGGVLRYRLDPDRGETEFQPLSLPRGIHLSFVWTGRPAETGSFLRQLQLVRSRQPELIHAALDRMAELSRAGLEVVEGDSAAELPEIIDHFSDAMEELGAIIAQPILSEDHLRLRRLARRHGLAYKPSGAGGGDFGMALSLSRQALDEFELQARALGYFIPPLEIDPRGLERAQGPMA